MMEVENTLKYIGKVQTLISIDTKINYDGFIEAVCSCLDINWSYNDKRIYMQNLATFSDLSYPLKDGYNIWIMMRLSWAHKRNSLFLGMVTSFKKVKTIYEY